MTLAGPAVHRNVTGTSDGPAGERGRTAPVSPREVVLFMVDAGGGHRAASRALVAAAEETGAPVRFRVENLQEALARVDLVKRLLGISPEAGYNLVLRKRWTGLLVLLLRFLHGMIRLRRKSLVREMTRFLAARQPAAVVSVVPNFNGVIRDALRAAHPGVPFVVVLTDFADFPPRFWIEPGFDRVIVGSERAAEQARDVGLPPERISLVSGMVLNPRFYRAGGPAGREQTRAELGAGPDDFVVVLLFGGKGSPEMEPLAERLLEAVPGARIVALCGDNPALAARVQRLQERSGGRCRCVGFTDRVADYMSAADLLVTKPGPGSLAEAFQKGLPVVVVRNHQTIPQERFNTDWVKTAGVGLVVGHWREIPDAVAGLQRAPERLAALRRAVAALPENRAVYEAVDLIAREARAARP
jgi:UDP-N-acetylglucosamine:LPS N-acetylglucosamine transferase